ncbi:hypothetical protein ACJX0J_036215, partial [Zea mays]
SRDLGMHSTIIFMLYIVEPNKKINKSFEEMHNGDEGWLNSQTNNIPSQVDNGNSVRDMIALNINERLENVISAFLYLGIEPHVFLYPSIGFKAVEMMGRFEELSDDGNVDAYNVCYAHKMVEEEDCKNMICFMVV